MHVHSLDVCTFGTMCIAQRNNVDHCRCTMKILSRHILRVKPHIPGSHILTISQMLEFRRSSPVPHFLVSAETNLESIVCYYLYRPYICWAILSLWILQRFVCNATTQGTFASSLSLLDLSNVLHKRAQCAEYRILFQDHQCLQKQPAEFCCPDYLT